MSVVYGSSLREVPISVTRQRVEPLLAGLGITRVTETTALDRIGVPVAAGIRPSAAPDNLCVSAGKGATVEEAMVGAMMEALEFAFAEPGRAPLPILSARVGDVLDGAQRPRAILDLCPMWGITLDLQAQIDCIEAADLRGQGKALVPAELVLHPYVNRGAGYFGSGTNGLASGNTVDEATVHALCELIERDVLSFHRIASDAPPISPASLPEPLAALAARLDAAGFDLVLRSLGNPFGLPVFHAVAVDRGEHSMTLPGSGCHLSAAIAAGRAITETVQARLTLIHGARDDLTRVWAAHAGRTREQIEETFTRAFATAPKSAPVAFAAIPEVPVSSVAEALPRLLEILARAGFPTALRVVYTPPGYPVAVVRVIVPGLETYSRETRRRGPRLVSFLRAQRGPSPRLW